PYGLHTDASDVDLKGVAIPPRAWILGYRRTFAQVDDADTIAAFVVDLTAEEQGIASRTKLEGSVYGLRKFIRLAADANPNILDVLFCRDAEVRRCTPLGRRLRDARGLFLSSRARQTYSGYARAQLGRIQRHRSWLLSPPAGAPTREQFGLPEMPEIPKEERGAAEAAIRKQLDRWELDLGDLPESSRLQVQAEVERVLTGIAGALDPQTAKWVAAARTVGLRDDLIEALKDERRYQTARRQWAAYQRWAAQRNRERAALEREHGYDTKHAAHLVRLLRMGREVLETGEVHVWRGPGGADDAAELQAIRAGKLSYDAVVALAQEGERGLQEVVREGRVAVPPLPDEAAIDRLCVELVEAALGR
ncbi:MAG: putative nucleotidyltransferase, partial [Myxococcota bacterium]